MSAHSHHTASALPPQPSALTGDSWEREIVPRLPSDLAEQARIHKAFQRVRGVASPSDLLRAILAFATEGFSSRAWGAWAVLVGLADISERAWRKRLARANLFLFWLLAELLIPPDLPADAPVSDLAARQRRVLLVDATRLRQIGGTGDDWRVHVAYDLLAARMADVVVSSGKGAEKLSHFAIKAGDIILSDNGYGYRKQLVFTKSKGADGVFRITLTTFPLEDQHGQVFDAIEWLRAHHGQIAEWHGWCRYAGQRLAVRMIASKLPTEKVRTAQKRKQRKAQKAGRKLSAQTLFLASWMVLVTSLDRSWLATDVLRLYRARWQIELVFKRFKQLLRLADIRSKQQEQVEATVRALLIAWVLQEKVSAEVRAQLPRGAADPHQAASSWLLAGLSVATLREQVRGSWTLARVKACLPRLERFLIGSRRGRRQQEADVRAWLEQRLRLAPDLLASV